MKDWEKAEQIICSLTGGKRTPGSGNKGIKGDVRIRGVSSLIECKQTAGDTMTLQYAWIKELEGFSTKFDVVLVIFFGLRGYVYWHVGPGEPGDPWVTRTLHEEDLPRRFTTNRSAWELDDLESLRELKK